MTGIFEVTTYWYSITETLMKSFAEKNFSEKDLFALRKNIMRFDKTVRDDATYSADSETLRSYNTNLLDQELGFTFVGPHGKIKNVHFLRVDSLVILENDSIMIYSGMMCFNHSLLISALVNAIDSYIDAYILSSDVNFEDAYPNIKNPWNPIDGLGS